MSGRLSDAILVARDVYKRFPLVLASRLDQHGQLAAGTTLGARGVRVFEAAPDGSPTIKDVSKIYAAEHRGVEAYDVETIIIPHAVATVVRGEDGEMKSPERIMRSVLSRYQTRAEIRLLDNLNHCWTRFAIAKELAHVIMDDAQGARAQTIGQQIKMAYTITRTARPDVELTSEQFAWFVASELMLPINDRDELLRRQRAGEDTMSLARSYWVPKYILDQLFETAYGALSNEL